MGGPREGGDFQNLHRNKRSMTLNLKAPEGLAAFKRMVKKADVVVENFRPDVKKRLGIDYKALAKINPRIVYASISGFGQDGPYANRPGFDQIAQGMGGLMSVTGLPGQGPVRVGIPIADLSAGLLAATGILVALLEREKSKKGQQVATSLLQAQIFMLDFQAARYLVQGEVAKQAGNNHPTSAPTGVYKTDDGYINIATAGQTIWKRFCEAIEAPELAKMPEYIDGAARSKNRDALDVDINKHLVGRTSARMDRAPERGRCAVRADLFHRQDVRRSAGRASRHRAKRDQEGQEQNAPGRPRRDAVAHAVASSWRGRRSSASTPTRCSRNSASASATSPRCIRRRRSNPCRHAAARRGTQ